MILDILAYFFITLAIGLGGLVLLLFVILVFTDNEPKDVFPLLGVAVILGGFVWALFHLGAM